MTVTVVPWALSAGRIGRSCLAQSCKSRTDNGYDHVRTRYLSVRISLRNGAFFYDVVDHEFESLVNNIEARPSVNLWPVFKHLKKR